MEKNAFLGFDESALKKFEMVNGGITHRLTGFPSGD
jgi:hypothetical protein